MLKKVEVSSSMGAGFKIESTIREHKIIVDQPANGGGTDQGPTPLEYQLIALNGCIGSIARIIAQQRQIKINAIDITSGGELDVDVLLGKNKEDRPGFKSFIVKCKIDADMSDEEKIAFLEEVDARCPISDILINKTPVEIKLA